MSFVKQGVYMSNDKIKITDDEINGKEDKIRIVISDDLPISSVPIGEEPHPIKKSLLLNYKNVLLIFSIIFSLVIIVGFLTYIIYNNTQKKEITKVEPKKEIRIETVDEWCSKTRKELNKELSDSDSNLRKRIEDAHLTVTVTMAEVKSLVANTLDGSNNSENGENISSCTIIIEFRWDGVFQQGGYSILETIYDIHNKKLIKSEIIETNAIINFENPAFWFKVGWNIGAFL